MHVKVGHVVIMVLEDDDIVKTYECETCLNRQAKKSRRQMAGRRFREGEVITE